MTGAALRQISLTAKAMVDHDETNLLGAIYVMLAAVIVHEADKDDARSALSKAEPTS